MNSSSVSIAGCSPGVIPTPTAFGVQVLNLTASWVTNFTQNVPAESNYNHGDIHVQNADFCNITVTYTHPGQDDHIILETWLPRTGWNGRFQAVGGGGWQAGRSDLAKSSMAGAIGEKYATSTTDAGLGSAITPDQWALASPRNVNLNDLQNLGYKSLYDQAAISKSLIESFYGQEPVYSYWNGCSQGGRQGLMLAQRYPTAYDGIAASAPAQSWSELALAQYYPFLVQEWAGERPLACELQQLTEEAVAHCDTRDGITDGIISDMSTCDFEPFTVVNETFYCASMNKTTKIRTIAATVADAAWTGPRSRQGKFLWYGFDYRVDITTYGLGQSNLTNEIIPEVMAAWARFFLQKDPTYNVKNMTREHFDWLFHLGVQEYTDIIGANNPDLEYFKNAGGKMIAYHGLVNQTVPNVKDFYRYFEVPGLGHCTGGKGGQPKTTFNALRRWVENGTAPETLSIEYPDLEESTRARIACPFPARAVYVRNDTSGEGRFRCE